MHSILKHAFTLSHTYPRNGSLIVIIGTSYNGRSNWKAYIDLNQLVQVSIMNHIAIVSNPSRLKWMVKKNMKKEGRKLQIPRQICHQIFQLKYWTFEKNETQLQK